MELSVVAPDMDPGRKIIKHTPGINSFDLILILGFEEKCELLFVLTI